MQDAIIKLNSLADKDLDGYGINRLSEIEDLSILVKDLFEENASGENIGVET